ncbi:LuxR family transcriptional regulator, partial [Frankia sp. AiPs1]|uniref:AAA family ATPase n=1 Tax=Frankia sp. AiPs1 TaxID=573493 RepID=UPI0035ABB301|nr:LuxR family transcriptional regulator [Frankia sp. AiPs1]
MLDEQSQVPGAVPSHPGAPAHRVPLGSAGAASGMDPTSDSDHDMSDPDHGIAHPDETVSGPDSRALPRPAAAAGLPLVRGHFVVPTPPSDCLDRPRLRQVLDEAVTRPLTVVRAPAGWGKTTLLAGWAAARPPRPPLVWIRIDPAATPTIVGGPTVPLWPQLLHGLGRAGLIPAGADLARADLAGPDAAAAHHPPDRGYRQLANLIADLPAPFVLVLDDVHLLRGRSDLDGLDLLVNEAGERARTILVGRTVPVALHRLRAAGRVTEIDADALAFTRSEAAELLRAQGVSAPAELVGGLLHATEGWAAGLRLAAGAVSRGSVAHLGEVFDAEHAGSRTGGSSPWVSSASAPQWAPAGGRVLAADPDPPSAALASAPEIVEFLRAELLARQPPAVHRLLLRTSVLESMTGPLADAVAGEANPAAAAQVLTEIAQRYGFVVAHHDGIRFRYHRLFAALLRADLARDRTEDVDELHLRAALWFAAHRRPAEAVRHAAWAGDWWYASCLLVDGAGMVDALCGAALRLEPILAAMPASWAAWAPECALVAAVGHLRYGRVTKATRSLETARVAIAAAAASRRRSLSTQADLVELRRAELAGSGEEMLGVARRLLRASPDAGAGQRRGAGRRVGTPSR